VSYNVRPEDVVVVDRQGRPIPPRGPDSGAAAWLRRYRLRIALAIAVVETVLLLAGSVHVWELVLLGIAAVAFHLTVGRNLRAPLLRQLSWIVAFSQGLVALLPAAVGTAVVAFVVVGTVVLLIALMVLLGERSR
jgi:hypothetical protein